MTPDPQLVTTGRATSTPAWVRIALMVSSSSLAAFISAWCTGSYLPCLAAASASRAAWSLSGERIGNSL